VQFRADFLGSAPPTTAEGIEKYLASARDLFQCESYGDDCDASGRAAEARAEFTASAMRSPRSASTALSEAA
jgi:hypothetical protein